jgi:hypothetical protein
MRRLLPLLNIIAFCLIASFFAAAQEQKPAVPMSASARLAAAKTAFVRNAGGSDIPFKVVEGAITAWGHFTLVDSREKADIIIDISAPYDDFGTELSSTTGTSPLSGRDEHSAVSTRQISAPRVVLTISDARTNLRLWTATERPKYAMRQKAREDNLVDAAQRLFSKLRDHVEPPAQL